MSAAGIWDGEAVIPAVPDVTTSFEGPDDADGFVVGTSPFSAAFQGGVTETRGIPGFYADGLKSWHIAGNNAGVIDATVTFETPIDTLTFFTRTVTNGNVAAIDVKDTNGAVIQTIVPPDANTPLQFSVDTAGGLPIASLDITISSGEIVIDSFTFGYGSTASTDDIACLFATTPNDEFVCVIRDAISGAVTASANGTFQVNGDQVSGSGNLYAAPGETLVDGTTIAPLTISAGTISERNSLDLTIDAAGLSISVSTTFDTSYDRGSDLATVAGVYSIFDIFGDPSSFLVDANGAITTQSNSGCVGNGQISIIDADFNAYVVTLDVSSCGNLDGMYDGLGRTQDNMGLMDNVFLFAVFTAQSMIVGDPTVVNQPGVFVDETAWRLPAESNIVVRAAVGDVDGDNDVDVIVAPGVHTGLSAVPPQDFLLQINDGTGVFTNEAASRLPVSAFGTQVASAVILGDVDGDTDLDAFVVNGSSGAVFLPGFSGFQNLLWINNGGGIFSDETISRLPLATNSSFHAAFGDLDSDGDLDLVIGNVGSSGTGQQNKLLINNGSGVFTDETTIRLPALPDITLALALEDLDGDFDLDIVVANRSPNGSKILVNNGMGFFTDQTAVRFGTPPPFAADVVVTDVNGDGSGDIIFASLFGGPLVFINSGGGDFTEETNARTPTFSGSHGLAVADVDTDGDVDIFVTVPGTQSRLLLNNGTGFFTDVSDTNLPTDSAVIRYPTFVDVDNDSDPDLYLPSTDGATNQDRLLINLGRP